MNEVIKKKLNQFAYECILKSFPWNGDIRYDILIYIHDEYYSICIENEYGFGDQFFFKIPINIIKQYQLGDFDEIRKKYADSKSYPSFKFFTAFICINYNLIHIVKLRHFFESLLLC